MRNRPRGSRRELPERAVPPRLFSHVFTFVTSAIVCATIVLLVVPFLLISFPFV